jgi:thymidylate synthase (FAD)
MNNRISCLNDGFVQLIDHMGSDQSICNAARVSYGNHENNDVELEAYHHVFPDAKDQPISIDTSPSFATLSYPDGSEYTLAWDEEQYQKWNDKVEELENKDRNLIRYLMRHRHCYHPDMQVLTTNGWKYWKNLSGKVEFLVPNHTTKQLQKEVLEVKEFDCDEELHCYQNIRMSYKVTEGHTMWFRGKYERDYKKVKVEDQSKWGHYECGSQYTYLKKNPDKRYELIGFFLGDGSFSSKNTICFHLKKERKIKYLIKLLDDLNLSYDIVPGWNGALKVSLETPYSIKECCVYSVNASNKGLVNQKLSDYEPEQLVGIFYGLIHSDGSKKKDRKGQVEFSSTSPKLAYLFESIASMLQYDCHKVHGGDKYNVTAYKPGRTTLESRKQYHYKEYHKGKVYCATSSTGLLMVRGASNEFSFICGNTTPFEMVSFVFLVRAPIHVARQWFRHRTWSYNEYSTRYKEAIDSFETTEPGAWRTQATNNKQGSGNYLTKWPEGATVQFDDEDEDDTQLIYREVNGEHCFLRDENETIGEYLTERERNNQWSFQNCYEERLALGVAREQARKDLPLSTYTEFYAKVDLHNLFHFLSLRLDSHAQLEIRTYAEAIAKTIQPIVPISYEAFEDYRLNGSHFSAEEMKSLRKIMSDHYSTYEGTDYELTKPDSLSDREWKEFKEKL